MNEVEGPFTSQQIFPNENNLRDIEGFIKTLDAVPSYTPRYFAEQFVLVTAGGSSRAYIYDAPGQNWLYVTLT